MPAAAILSSLLAALFLLAGCASPYTTRLPTVGINPPLAEKRAYERHDPFPNERIGPDTQTRPLGFVDPRTEDRKALEGRMLNALQPENASPFPTPPMSGMNYPEAVPQ
jgi:hypothetical protein